MTEATVHITEAWLTPPEKRRMRKVFAARLSVLVLMVLPLFCGLSYIVYLAVMSFADGRQDVFSYLVPVFFGLFCLAAGKYIFPGPPPQEAQEGCVIR